ncbi:MAG TPA: glycoside hydrolase family 3 C-terminal domain-containing protein [Candidatus Dormibacteraeota bacterium]
MTIDVSQLVDNLTLEQKVRLLTGADAWTLHAEPSIGLRPLVMSDGPAGVRGRSFDRSLPSSSLPAPIGLGATWDEELIESLTFALGHEVRARGVDVLLAPTVNIIRTPLSGRAFECFSEDPLLTSRIAVAYVRGLQRAGVGATVKHYVGNDSETERRTYNAHISEAVLRELYLPPFEACVNEADVALVMAAYNSVNGAFMTANPILLRGLLKGEWAFDGVVVSDWTAAQTTAPSALAGLDLVMPGPRGPWGELLISAVRTGAVPADAVDDKVARLLRLAMRVGALNGHVSPSVQADSSIPSPRWRGEGQGEGNLVSDRELIDDRLLCEVTARSFVLLKNRNNLLPLQPRHLKRVALIGPNVGTPQTQGGGSIRVLPIVRPDPAASLRSAVGDGVIVTVDEGCVTWPTIPMSPKGAFRDPVTGEPGIHLEVRGADGTVLRDTCFSSNVLTWWDELPAGVNVPGSQIVMQTRYEAAIDGLHLIGASGIGLLRISVDGKAMAEARTLQPREIVEAFSRPPEVRVPVELRAGQTIDVRLEYRPEIRDYGFVTARLGVALAPDEDRLLDEAAKAAKDADVAILVVGSADGTESEGYDRRTMSLPGRQDELIAHVAAANPRTIVIVNAGSPVLMPWADKVAAVMQVWLPGQAFGEALTACLLGTIEPGGRLPVSLPRTEADSPVLHAQPIAGELPYAEGLLVGYRGYDRRGVEPQYAFGHGLGFTEWDYESLEIDQPAGADHELGVTVKVRNTGNRVGREVVQLYLQGPDGDASRPLRGLVGFANVTADPGTVVAAHVTIPARAFSRWEDESHGWVVQRGPYRVHAGRSSRDLRLHSDPLLA